MEEQKINETLQDMARRSSLVVRLLALLVVRDEKRPVDRIGILHKVGFAPKEIAELLGTTANAVRVALFHIRRRNKGK